MRSYIALIHKDPDSDYGVSFPDVPGCVTAGESLEEARVLAAEALEMHLAGMIEDGEAAPEPSTLEFIMADRANRDAVAVLVELPAVPDRTVRVNITLPAEVLEAIDRYAAEQGLTRSGFLARAAKQAMAA